MIDITLKDYTDQLPRKERGAVRDYFTDKLGISERSYYNKLKHNSWNMLEHPIVYRYIKSKINKNEKKQN